MASSDFDPSNPSMFKTDASFDVAFDEVDGVKKNPRIDNPKFTLGGVEFRCDSNENHWNEEYPIDFTIEVPEESLSGLGDYWFMAGSVVWKPTGEKYYFCLFTNNPKGFVFNFGSATDHFDLVITMDFRSTHLYRLPFVDAEAAKKNRSDCKIILEEDTTRPIYVNKAVLASHSDFFQTMFFGDFQEKDQEEVKISDVTEGDFLQYLYCVQPPIKPFVFENLEATLRLADRFQNDVLLSSIEKFLRRMEMDSEEKRQTLVWAERYQMKILFHEILEDMELEELKDVDSVTTSQFKQPFIESFLKRVFIVMEEAYGKLNN